MSTMETLVPGDDAGHTSPRPPEPPGAPPAHAPAALDRRAFMGWFSSVGLGSTLLPGVLWAQAQEQETVTPAMVQAAAEIAGLEFTEEEREQIARGIRNNARNWEELRAVPLPNSVVPAVQFDPVVPGVNWDARQLPMRMSPDRGVRRPGNLEEVAFWSVRDLAELVRTRQVTPGQLTRMYLDRLKRHGPTLEAVVNLTEERALRQAEAMDREIAAGHYRGPLHGIPWGAKDLLAVKGYPTTWGAEPYVEQVLDYDATVVERLDAAGAILVAKLTLGALAQGDRWFGGQTKSPWNLERGSSGSSAGPGSTTAAGLVGFAIGSETLGSIASPSARNGNTGLRPSFGYISRHGAMALSWSMDKLGPMCRYAEDCALVLAAVRGPDGRDLTLRDIPFNWDAAVGPRDLRIGYLRAAFESDNLSDFDRAALAVVRELAGQPLVPVDLPDQYPVGAVRAAVLAVEAAAAFDDLTRSERDNLMEESSSWPRTFRNARFTPAVEYINANRVRTLIMHAMQDVMKDVDVVVAPGTGGAALTLTNLTGHPQVILPDGFSQGGEPTALSFIGGLYKDAAVLAVARAYQDATEFHLRRPPLFTP